MRIFEQGYKWNFVDTTDCYVGYDNGLNCCESFGYAFFPEHPTQENLNDWRGAIPEDTPTEAPPGAEAMVFDREFFKSFRGNYAGGWAVFRLTRPLRQQNDARYRELERQQVIDGSPDEMFLALYNHHNGYYCHGFELGITGGQVIKSGGI